MTREELQRLPNGLYRVSWKDGSQSDMALGTTRDGQRWVAPTNWVSPLIIGRRHRFKILRMDRIMIPVTQGKRSEDPGRGRQALREAR